MTTRQHKDWLVKIRYTTKRRDKVLFSFDTPGEAEAKHRELRERYGAASMEWYVKRNDGSVPRVWVYKRDAEDTRSYSPDRPWMVGDIPEDPRETCYETWADAMAWATMPTEEREAWIVEDARTDGGW